MSTAYDHGNPSNAEQYLVELINRARSDPAAEAARYGIDLNEGLRPGTLSPAPRAPLPFNPMSLKAAAEHAEWLLPQHPFPSHPRIGLRYRVSLQPRARDVGGEPKRSHNTPCKALWVTVC